MDVAKRIDDWIFEHRPFGMEKLVLETQLSRALIEKVRSTNEKPKNKRCAERLMNVLGLVKPKTKAS